MITQELSTLLRDIDRTLFKLIDKVATTEGYAVDRSVPGIRDNKSDWDEAEAIIIAVKGFSVGIRSSINSHDMGTKKIPRIVYHPQRSLPGTIGMPVAPILEPTILGSFNRTKYANQTSDYYFQVSVHAQKPNEFRILQAIVATAMSHRDYVQLLNSSPTESFLIEQIGYTDNWNEVKGTYDIFFQYKACNFFITEPKIDDLVISKITEMEVVDVNGDSIVQVAINLYHIITLGVSQSAGGAGSNSATPSLTSLSNPDVLTLTNGPLAPSTVGSFIPLLEGDTYNQDPVAQSIPNVETQASAMGHQLKAFLGGTDKVCVTIHYRGATTIQDLSQGGAQAALGYTQIINTAARVKSLCTAGGYNYIPIFIIQSGGNGANPYDTALATLISQVRAGITPSYSGTLRVLLAQPRVALTPDLSPQIWNTFINVANTFITFSQQDIMLTSEIQPDGIHLTNHGQRRMGINNAIAIEEILRTNAHQVMTLDVANTVYNSNLNTLTIPVLGSTGAIVGTGDFGMKITHPDLTTIITGTWAVSDTNIVFTMITNIPITTTIITVNVMYGTGTLRDSRTVVGIMFNAGDGLPYNTNRRMIRNIITKSVTFAPPPAAILSSPVDTETGSTTASISVSTNTGSGVLYWVASGSATVPSAAQIKAGQNHLGAGVVSGNQVVASTGTQNASVTGLVAATAYFIHFIQVANSTDSNIVSGNGFTTNATSYTATGKIVGINFVGTTLVNSQAGYNNLVNPQPPTIALLRNDDVTASGFSVLMGSNWGAGTADNGETSVDFPVNVTLRSSAGNVTTEAILTLQGLDPTKAYDLNTLHSRSGTSGGTATVAHEGLTTNSRTLDTQENNIAVIATYNVMKSVKLKASAGGNIVIRITRGTDPFYRINGLIITEFNIV